VIFYYFLYLSVYNLPSTVYITTTVARYKIGRTAMRINSFVDILRRLYDMNGTE